MSGKWWVWCDHTVIVVLKVLFFLRFDPQLDTPTNSGDVLYRVAYVGEMIASEAFCHISRSFHKSIGPSNARIASFLATNIRSEWSHLIWAKIGSDQMRPFRSDVSFSTLSRSAAPRVNQPDQHVAHPVVATTSVQQESTDPERSSRPSCNREGGRRPFN